MRMTGAHCIFVWCGFITVMDGNDEIHFKGQLFYDLLMTARKQLILCLSTALCGLGTWNRKRSTSLCSNPARSRGRRWRPHAAPTAEMGSSLQLAAKTVPSRSGTETSAWVLKHTHIPNITTCIQCGCKHRVSVLLWPWVQSHEPQVIWSQAREVRGQQVINTDQNSGAWI